MSTSDNGETDTHSDSPDGGATHDVAVVIPSIKEHIRTLDSIPDGVPVSVESEGSLNEARNRGVENSDADLIVVMDDDIAFSEETFDDLVSMADPDTLIGIEDWDYGLVAGRVMVFHRALWADVGGFDERLVSHMGDTEFALGALANGYRIETVPRDWFDHEPHERSVTTWDRAWRLVYLCIKYPRHAGRLVSGTFTDRWSQ